MIKREIHENGILADYFAGTSSQSSRTVIMLGGSEGGKSWSRIKKPIQALTNRGYSVLSLAYFGLDGLPDSLECIPVEYFIKAIEWLSNHPGVMSKEVAIIGGSKGAEAALLLSSLLPEIKVVIAFSPSHVIWQGIPKTRWNLGIDPRSSWTYRGDALPFVPYLTPVSKWELLTLQLRNLHECSLTAHAGSADAVIRVEDMQAALLLISGRRDRLWPSIAMCGYITRRLEEHDYEWDYEHIVVDTGHNGTIMNRGIWQQIFDFLDEHYA